MTGEENPGSRGVVGAAPASSGYFRAAAVFLFFGVALGAFGAHGLERIFAANGRRGAWETAAFYHLVHAVALLVLANRQPFPRGPWTLLAVGIVIFSGSLYVLAATGMTWLGAVTPLGGVCFLAGWAWVAGEGMGKVEGRRRKVGAAESASPPEL